MESQRYTISFLQEKLRTRESRLEELLHFYLAQIENKKDLNAFISVYRPFEQAAHINHKIEKGRAGRLAGLILAIKDNICYQGHPSFAASKILKGFHSLFTATALERLLREDALVIGSTNCDEFAMGSSNENSSFGPVRNPYNPEYVSGGSSGGSAVAVAANMAVAALGSDTGGSIRQPASFCGVIGIKPTYGLISRYGLIAYASSFDQIGIFSNTIEDAAAILEVMAGYDSNDNTTAKVEIPPYTQLALQPLKRAYRLAVPDFSLQKEGLDPEIYQFFIDFIDGLKQEGHVVEVVPFPLSRYLMSTYYILTTAEASSNLARYDGIRYGFRAEGSKSLTQLYTLTRSLGFGKEVKRRIMLGTFVLSAGYFDAYYRKAQQLRRLIQQDTLKILEEYDFILTPTAPTPAFGLGEKTQDPLTMYMSDVLTVHCNLYGGPGISLPLGWHSKGLPFGMQLMGNYFSEAEMLCFSNYLMQIFCKTQQK
ncbi:MAG: Asp-tRNA(Asn)/Glu-tRNA(Gln) amidotransferase subunit GatA [Bacteroidia bacterium]|nr:Asp-tRNA(Asn)/Glu-tRNA(Gln) amidotransferase subunit GatA [Bacteroidia bacterium]MDW8157954.1 Asp-tRNA(Asn)/Glu-tRNA(Gln) amidotransferase subunit GatA [Bacteroidia bacterium]